MRHDRKGFTLIELLIVVVIIGILATIAIGQFNEARERAMLRVAQNDLRALAIQQEIYHHTFGVYAGNPGPPDFTRTQDVVIAIGENTNAGWGATAYHAGYTTGTCGIIVGAVTDTTAGDSGDPNQTAGSVYCGP